MAGWRLVVRELYERGPLRARDLRPSYSKDAQRNVGSDLRRAAELGLLTLPGRCGVHAVYRLTPSGVAFAQGKLEVIVPEYRSPARGGRPKGVRCVLRPTWLSALPAAAFQGVTMADDREPRKAGCSGGLGPFPWGDDVEAWLGVSDAEQVAADIRAYAAQEVAAERERIKARLRDMNDATGGRHNYYAHAALVLFERA